jgi:hypothetical protein
MTTAADEVTAMKSYHSEATSFAGEQVCFVCTDPWPCDAARLIAFYEAVTGLADQWEAKAKRSPGDVYYHAQNCAAGAITALAEQHLGGGK